MDTTSIDLIYVVCLSLVYATGIGLCLSSVYSAWNKRQVAVEDYDFE